MNLYAQRYNNTFEEFQLSPDMFTFSSIYLACVAIIGTVTNGAILIFLLCKKEVCNITVISKFCDVHCNLNTVLAGFNELGFNESYRFNESVFDLKYFFTS